MYLLAATIPYHADPTSEQQPIVFSRDGIALDKREWHEFHNKMYSSPECKYKDLLRYRRSPPCLRCSRLPGGRFVCYNFKFAISRDNSFHEIAPGMFITFELQISLNYWLRELRPGAEYTLASIGEPDAIPFWPYGTLEV